jgi:hypothetical protein
MTAHFESVRYMVGFAALLLVSACETIHVQTDYDQSFSFAGHDTFTWVSEHPMVIHSVDVSPFAEGRIEQAIISALQAKGVRYVTDPAEAELLVGFSVSARERISVTSVPYPGPYWGPSPWIGPYPGPYWGPYPWVGAYYDTVDVHQYSVGRLTIDIFDIAEKLPVWHGSATKNIGVDPVVQGKQVASEAVPKILATFPPNPIAP